MLQSLLLVILIVVALALIGVVLLQRSEGGGLGVGSGGGGLGGFMTARGTSNLLTKTTAILAALFMALSLLLAYMASNAGPRERRSIIDTPVGGPLVPSPFAPQGGVPGAPASVPAPGGTPAAPASPAEVPAPQVPLAR
jgi:preprotein translocase subunit SecG